MGKFGASAMPSRPRSQKLCTLALRSAKTSGVVSVSESNTLITPRFSATKTRPSLLNRTTVGLVKPLKTVDSWNPAGRVAASADLEVADNGDAGHHHQQHGQNEAGNSAVSRGSPR